MTDTVTTANADSARHDVPVHASGVEHAPPLAMPPGVPDSVLRIPVSVQVVIGSTRLPLSRIAQLSPGSTIALDQKLGAPATILVNGREVAHGELFVLDGEDGSDRLGITITTVLEPGSMDRG